MTELTNAYQLAGRVAETLEDLGVRIRGLVERTDHGAVRISFTWMVSECCIGTVYCVHHQDLKSTPLIDQWVKRIEREIVASFSNPELTEAYENLAIVE